MCGLTNKWALVTGASRGIGRAYSILLASKKCNLVIVARNKDDLEELQKLVVKKFTVKCYIIKCDLSKQNAANEIFEQVQILNLEMNILISNAGIGCYGIFGEMPIDRQKDMMIINTYNPVVLTHKFINQAKNSGTQYYIVHIGSIVGYKALPGSSVYNASKSFIMSFVKSLNIELSSKWNNISAVVVSPGATRSDFFRDANKAIPKINKMFMMSAEDVALIGFRAMLKRKTSVICGFRNKLLVLLMKLIPIKLIAKSPFRK